MKIVFRYCLGLVSLWGCAHPSFFPVSDTTSSVPLCRGACLAGRDPYEVGCAADATTVQRADVRNPAGDVVASVELRQSPRCGTGWARALRTPGNGGTLVASVRSAGSASTFEHPSDGEVWTDMVPLLTHACVTATGTIRPKDGVALDAAAEWCGQARLAATSAE